MTSGFNIFRKIQANRYLQVAWRPDQKQAEDLMARLNDHWPAEYSVEKAGDNSTAASAELGT